MNLITKNKPVPGKYRGQSPEKINTIFSRLAGSKTMQAGLLHPKQSFQATFCPVVKSTFIPG